MFCAVVVMSIISGILGAITGRAIYEGSLNLREAQLLLDQQSL